MIAAVDLGRFKDFQACTKIFVKHGKTYYPIVENVERYQIYQQTRQLTDQLADFR